MGRHLSERQLREAGDLVRQRVGLLQPPGRARRLHEVHRWLIVSRWIYLVSRPLATASPLILHRIYLTARSPLSGRGAVGPIALCEVEVAFSGRTRVVCVFCSRPKAAHRTLDDKTLVFRK